MYKQCDKVCLLTIRAFKRFFQKTSEGFLNPCCLHVEALNKMTGMRPRSYGMRCSTEWTLFLLLLLTITVSCYKAMQENDRWTETAGPTNITVTYIPRYARSYARSTISENIAILFCITVIRSISESRQA